MFVHAYTTARCPHTFRESIRPLMWRLPHIMAGILSAVSVKSLFLLRLSSLRGAPRAQEPRCDPALIDLFACTSVPPPVSLKDTLHYCVPHPDANFIGLLGQNPSNEVQPKWHRKADIYIYIYKVCRNLIQIQWQLKNSWITKSRESEHEMLQFVVLRCSES